jgi:hypothetical protein
MMFTPDAQWEARAAALWASLNDESDDAAFIAAMAALVGELPADCGVARFERAAAYDSTGHSELAAPLYREALDAGLPGERRRRAVIQMASSLRNVGRAEESVALLTAELANGHDPLHSAVGAFLALALVDVGREREAVSVALTALVPHLPRYNRSLARYAVALVDPSA